MLGHLSEMAVATAGALNVEPRESDLAWRTRLALLEEVASLYAKVAGMALPRRRPKAAVAWAKEFVRPIQVSLREAAGGVRRANLRMRLESAPQPGVALTAQGSRADR